MKLGFFIINNVVGGGGMVATQDAINALINNGHEVTIFMQQIITDKSKHLLNAPKARYVECGNLNEYSGICSLLRAVKEYGIEVFITHCHYYLPVIKCFESIKKLGVKVVLNEHHLNFIPIYENRFELFKEREKYLKSVDLITVIEETSYHIWKIKGYPVALLPNTIPDLVQCHNDKKKVILLSGRFTDFKQIELGIVAFALISKKHPGWTLKILGQGPRLKSIKNTINNCGAADRISLIGWTNTPEKYFEEASIHILPSYTEPFGLVIADAKKHKVPTVMFDIKSNDLVRDGVDGYKVPMNDVKAMSAKIESLIKNEALRTRFGQVALDNILEHDSKNVIRIWDQLLRYVLGLSVTDYEIYKKYIDIEMSKSALRNLIYDYDQLLYWVSNKNLKQNKKINQTNYLSVLMKKVVNYFGNRIFNFASKHCATDRIVLWDSNRVGQLRETIGEQKFNLKVKEIIPNGYLTPSLAWNLAKAKVFITNTNTGVIKKLQNKPNGKATVINVWHGAGYFKKFGVHEANIGELEFKNKYGTPDYVLCSSAQIRDKYGEIFAIPNLRVLPFGSTRTDLFFNEDFIGTRVSAFFRKFPKLKGKKLYLIAPTWRGMPFQAETASFELPIGIETLKANLRDDEAMLIKNHQLVIKTKNTNIDYKLFDTDSVVNVDDWSMQDLLLACHTVITDYSSLLFDALVLNKPVLMWAPDIEAYNQTIGFYDDYSNYVPGEMYTGTDPEQFFNAVREADKFVGTPKYELLKKKFVSACDGNSSKRLASFINNDIDLTDYRKRWTAYIKRVSGIVDIQADDQKFWNKQFVKLFIKGLPKQIHYEFQGKERGKCTNLCFHIEDRFVCDDALMDSIKVALDNEFVLSTRGNHFFEISKHTSLKKVESDIRRLNAIVSSIKIENKGGYFSLGEKNE